MAEHTLIEPTILITEAYNVIGRHLSKETADKAVKELINIVDIFADCDTAFCQKAGLSGVELNTYSADSLYLQTAIEFKSKLVSLDEGDFIKRVRAKDSKFDIAHVRELEP